MTDRANTGLRALLTVFGLWVLGALAVATSFLVSIHPFEWSEDPRLSAQIDHDGVLAVSLAALLGALVLAAQIALAGRQLTRGRRVVGGLGIGAGGLLLVGAILRLVEVLPHFRG